MRTAKRFLPVAAVVLAVLALAQCNQAQPTPVDTGAGGQPGGQRVKPTLDSPAPTSTPTQDGVEIEVEDGEVFGPIEIAVDQGRSMTLEIKSDVQDRVHVHGYDVLVDVGPGQDANFQFEATLAGVFEVELEESGLLLTRIRVRA